MLGRIMDIKQRVARTLHLGRTILPYARNKIFSSTARTIQDLASIMAMHLQMRAGAIPLKIDIKLGNHIFTRFAVLRNLDSDFNIRVHGFKNSLSPTEQYVCDVMASMFVACASDTMKKNILEFLPTLVAPTVEASKEE